MGHSDKSNLDVDVYMPGLDCYASMAQYLCPKKKQKSEHLSSITLAYLHAKRGIKKPKHVKRLRVLFDSGCSATLVNVSAVRKLKKKLDKTTKWTTKAGSFKTTQTCKLKFILPEFHANCEIHCKAYVEDFLRSCYDIIIGRDLLHELGVDLLFSQATMVWDNAEVPMRSLDYFDQQSVDDMENEIMYLHDPLTTEAERIQTILDAKYAPADLDAIVQECNSLNKDEQAQLLSLLKRFEHVFDGTLGTWKTDPVDLELKESSGKPYHAKPYPVPHSQEKQLQEEVDRLCKQGIM